jgi:hypothetical protein
VSDPKQLAALTAGTFAPHVGREFEVVAGGQSILLSLVDVEASRHSAPDTRRGFSLVFLGEAVLAQGVHTVVHPDLGALDIFMVPIGPGHWGLQYQAIFN